MHRGTGRALVRLAAFLLLTAALLGAYVIATFSGPTARRSVQRLWSRGTCRILGVRVRFEGEPFRACPTLFVANHVSYLDVPILNAFLDATFIAKSEVAGWPLFGLLARLCHTFFIRRHWRDALIQRNDLAARMRAGESFILFGEGTSTNGLAVRRFKTTLLSVMEPWVLDCPVAAQPVTLAYRSLADGRPIGTDSCDLYAWHGDAALLPHLWRVLHLEGVEVDLVVRPSILSWSIMNRKALGIELQWQVAEELARRCGHDREPLCAPAPAHPLVPA